MPADKLLPKEPCVPSGVLLAAISAGDEVAAMSAFPDFIEMTNDECTRGLMLCEAAKRLSFRLFARKDLKHIRELTDWVLGLERDLTANMPVSGLDGDKK